MMSGPVGTGSFLMILSTRAALGGSRAARSDRPHTQEKTCPAALCITLSITLGPTPIPVESQRPCGNRLKNRNCSKPLQPHEKMEPSRNLPDPNGFPASLVDIHLFAWKTRAIALTIHLLVAL